MFLPTSIEPASSFLMDEDVWCLQVDAFVVQSEAGFAMFQKSCDQVDEALVAVGCAKVSTVLEGKFRAIALALQVSRDKGINRLCIEMDSKVAATTFKIGVMCNHIGTENVKEYGVKENDGFLLMVCALSRFDISVLSVRQDIGHLDSTPVQINQAAVGVSSENLKKENLGSDYDGCVELSGLLKVTAGYGENVSLSLLSDNNKVLFKQEFQIEKRQLRIASKVPVIATAGSKLENMVFEIVNSDGIVDETFHHEDKTGGLSHMLAIMADWLHIEKFRTIVSRLSFLRIICLKHEPIDCDEEIPRGVVLLFQGGVAPRGYGFPGLGAYAFLGA
uniref:Uncharacterized protein n=1 Tax=Cannabis sativa TaxID=3483 RepID=A0A803PUR5_CANSA